MKQELAVRRALDPAPPLPHGVTSFLKLVADPNRLRILAVLVRGERCVCDIEAAVRLPQNLVSHHLSVLKREGLVLDRREGRWVYYRIEPQTLGTRLKALVALLDLQHAERRAVPCAEDSAP
jgi:DNA-binding transcriptional ArsR family regulator